MHIDQKDNIYWWATEQESNWAYLMKYLLINWWITAYTTGMAVCVCVRARVIVSVCVCV